MDNMSFEAPVDPKKDAVVNVPITKLKIYYLSAGEQIPPFLTDKTDGTFPISAAQLKALREHQPKARAN